MLKILSGRRWKDYKNILNFALENQYELGSISDLIKSQNQKPFIILRHDVDQKDAGVNRILQIEKKLGLRSSWYFRWQTANKKIIKDITNAGSEASLHFETLATVCKKYNINQRADINHKIIKEAQELLKKEIEEFRSTFHTQCKTIASHGHRINRQIEMANNEIIDEKLYEDTGVFIEAYDKRLMDIIDCYISDDSLLNNYGWAYGMNIKEAIESGFRKIYFLSHPHHWDFSLERRVRLSIKFIKYGVQKNNKKFRVTYQ